MKNLISAEQLNSQLNSHENIHVFDCRFALNDPKAGYRSYQAGHIPGAHYLDLDKDLSSKASTHGGRHPLPDFEQLQQTLQGFGVDQDSHIVFYDAHRGAYACRAWWLLNHCGMKNVSVLNGGLAAWEAVYSLDTKPSEARSIKAPNNINALALKPGQREIRNQQDIVNKQAVGLLIDSRELPRFQGLTEPIDPIAGHIPGAINLPWQTATTETGFFLEEESARQRLSQIDQQQAPLTVYCGSGVTACVNIFALAQLGIDAALYPGSWSDWCSYTTEHNRSARVATS